MAIVHFVKSKRTQTVGGLNAVINYCCKDAKVSYEGRPLVSGINCVPHCALQEFMNTKRLHHSTQDGCTTTWSSPSAQMIRLPRSRHIRSP